MKGFRKLKTGLPAATSRSLIRAIIDAKIGDEKLVPAEGKVMPANTMSKPDP
jgi:hypothetical protein